MPSSLLQVVNSLFQTCYNNWEQAVQTQAAGSSFKKTNMVPPKGTFASPSDFRKTVATLSFFCFH
jgi:hypothetical protein